MNNDDSTFLRVDEALAYVGALDQGPKRSLLRLAISQLRMRCVRQVDMTDAEWAARLPVSPVDLLYVVKALEEAFSKTAVLQSILEGKSVAEGTGWEAIADPE